ncbi:hypothetical protein [Sphingomonas turrisvirgatae]|uniref:Uncharacterized protein n=1 Tax=Sphingomonas turrisvirgatae TaxID=1888892 RepID=A0A1E3LWQ5_9SPHN|nr:hypothetical protein [Sphingomonas turrisvirgatae]ODP38179.1 hypothetical protein BFL28_15200 [Sphingomonas turrisvirgatae]
MTIATIFDRIHRSPRVLSRLKAEPVIPAQAGISGEKGRARPGPDLRRDSGSGATTPPAARSPDS